MRLRRLTDNGIERMARFIESHKTDMPEARPDILFDDRYSEDLPVRVIIDPHPGFHRRFELAGYMYHVLKEANLSDSRRDKGLWAWWALAWFDELTRRGEIAPGDITRWVPQLQQARRYYRHLLLGPYLIYVAHSDLPTRACGLLSDPPFVATSEAYRLFVEIPRLVACKAAVETATALYYDETKGSLRRGSGAKGAGGLRRLIDVIQQLDMTFDVHSLRASDLLVLLPAEFAKFMSDRERRRET